MAPGQLLHCPPPSPRTPRDPAPPHVQLLDLISGFSHQPNGCPNHCASSCRSPGCHTQEAAALQPACPLGPQLEAEAGVSATRVKGALLADRPQPARALQGQPSLRLQSCRPAQLGAPVMVMADADRNGPQTPLPELGPRSLSPPGCRKVGVPGQTGAGVSGKRAWGTRSRAWV